MSGGGHEGEERIEKKKGKYFEGGLKGKVYRGHVPPRK